MGTTVDGKGIRYTAERVIGNGSFGVVFLAKTVGSGELVAIKKVLQDKRYKNRELQIMRVLNHCNVMALRHYFYSAGEKSEDVFLNLVLEYVPDTVFHFYRQFSKKHEPLPMIFTKLFAYQLLRSLNYIHGMGVCHRDIKPQNLLIDPETGVLKLCDFGSAKVLVAGELNVAYICSRYYRAPELIFGATKYTSAVDIWSAGCVIAELALGTPLFPGESSVDQLVEIIKVLGTPTKEESDDMHPTATTDFKFPSIKPCSWGKVFKPTIDAQFIDLMSKLLVFSPHRRLHPLAACAHPLFDELRDPKCRLPNGRPLPELFSFTDAELRTLPNPKLRDILIPSFAHS